MKDFAKSIRTNNSNVSNKATVLKDGNVWVVLYANETKSQEFETEKEAREFAKKVGNSKVGNGLREDMMKEDGYAKEVRTSATYEAILQKPWKVYDILGVTDSELRELAFRLICKKYGLKYDEIYNAWLKNKWPEGSRFGNRKVGNRSVEQIEKELNQALEDKESYFRNRETPPKSLEERIKRLESELKREKTGNDDIGLRPVQGEIEKEVYSVYTQTGKDKEKTKKSLKAKHPHLDEQWLDKLLSKLVGNESIYKQEASLFGGLGEKAEKEIGNATCDEYNAEIQRLTKKAEQLRRMGQGKSAMEIEKQIEKLGKEMREAVGNETKGERKFGKVMGEFEEGALKTPQGKTVTDPAQAKAIAYSEADKVDNLKRARNSINNKKCGNATKTFSGKFLDMYDNGNVVVKEGWAFGEKFNEDNFGRWIEEQIRAKEKVLQECKQMKREFEST